MFRYFPSKLDLVITIGAWKWAENIAAHQASLPSEALERMTGAERLRFYMDGFLDLYRNSPDIMRFILIRV